jgi:hypothetical protein
MKFLENQKEKFNRVRFLSYYLDGHNGFIAGGCFKNVFLKQKIKDIDIFFKSEKDFIEAETYFKTNEDYVFSYENKNTISFKNKKTNIHVELIRKEYGSPQEILSIFDFSITKFAMYRSLDEQMQSNDTCVYVDTYFEDLANNKLVIDGDLKYPISTFERSYRYRDYGFGLCKESKQKLIDALKLTAQSEDISNDLYFGID